MKRVNLVSTKSLPGSVVERLTTVQSEAEFFSGIRSTLDKLGSSPSGPAECKVSFESEEARALFFTQTRTALLEAVYSRGRFDSINAAVLQLGFSRAVVRKDLMSLVELGLLQVHKEPRTRGIAILPKVKGLN